MTDQTPRAVPYVCPFCAEEDLRPVPEGRWHCRSCLRVFSLGFHGVHPADSDSADHSADRIAADGDSSHSAADGADDLATVRPGKDPS